MDKRLLGFGVAVFGVIVIAIGFRFYDLQNYPPGLFPDVAANGEDAKEILKGDYRAFYARNNGREGLLFYLDALAIKYHGVGVWQLYVPTAVIGVLTVIAIYFATQVFFGRLAGVLAALFAATSAWHVTISRTGFRASLAPLFLAAFTAFVGYTISAAKAGNRVMAYVYAALAGVTFSGGFYSYISYRAVVGVVLGVVVLLLLAALHEKIGFPHFRRYGGQIVVGVLFAAITLAPLTWYFAAHPSEFVGRAGQVSIFNPDLQRQVGADNAWEALTYSTRESVKGFFVGNGDRNWRHSVAGYPLLNPIVGLLFLLGFLWAIQGTVGVLWRMLRGEEVHMGMVYPYLLLLLLGMLAPVVTTAEGIPHGLRSLGLFFPIMMLSGTAGAVILHWIAARIKQEAGRSVAFGLVVGVVLLSSLYDAALYFLVARNTAEAHFAYRADLTEVAKLLVEHSGDAPTPYLVLDDFSAQTVHFLVPDTYTLVKPDGAAAATLVPGQLIIFTQSTLTQADAFGAADPTLEMVDSRRNRFGQEVMRVFRAPGTPPPAPAEPETPNLDA